MTPRKPGPSLRIVGDMVAQYLDGNGPAAFVQGEMNHAHAALAQLLHDAVGAQPVVLDHLCADGFGGGAWVVAPGPRCTGRGATG